MICKPAKLEPHLLSLVPAPLMFNHPRVRHQAVEEHFSNLELDKLSRLLPASVLFLIEMALKMWFPKAFPGSRLLPPDHLQASPQVVC